MRRPPAGTGIPIEGLTNEEEKTFPMDTQQISAPSRTPSSGVVHSNSRHTSRFTVVGNHLTQHRELSLTAIGLAAHIQSLPAGARIGIRFLAERFPESEARIAAALRELEAHGYLERTRERLPSGRVVTRTVSYNRPTLAAAPVATPQRRPQTRPIRRAPEPLPPAPAPQPDAEKPAVTHVPPRPSLPQPQVPDLDRHRAATDLLADLRRHEPRLLLAEGDIRRLRLPPLPPGSNGAPTLTPYAAPSPPTCPSH